VETAQRLTGAVDAFGQRQFVSRFSYLYYADSPEVLWLLHVLGFAIVVLFTVGLFTRITNILSLIVVLSYIHRAPMITGQFEPVLTMILFYLCLAPAGRYLSVDAWLRARKAVRDPRPEDVTTDAVKTSAATFALRLMQVHLAAFYLMLGLSKLGGIAWWSGEAAWWLIAEGESGLMNLRFLHSHSYLINLWTHAIVLFELSFPLLIWNRLARPLLLSIAVIMWISLALLTGLISFSAIMLVANLSFVSPSALRAVCSGPGKHRGESQPHVEQKSAKAMARV
jgi:hypothetical protein